MRFTVDVGELAVVLELDTEPAEVDLTRDGLGDACLDAAVEGMLGSHRAQASPDGHGLGAAVGRDGPSQGPRGDRGPVRDPPGPATLADGAAGHRAAGRRVVLPEHRVEGRRVRRARARLPRRPSAHREPGAADPGLDAGGAGGLPPAGVRGGRAPRPPAVESRPPKRDGGYEFDGIVLNRVIGSILSVASHQPDEAVQRVGHLSSGKSQLTSAGRAMAGPSKRRSAMFVTLNDRRPSPRKSLCGGDHRLRLEPLEARTLLSTYLVIEESSIPSADLAKQIGAAGGTETSSIPRDRSGGGQIRRRAFCSSRRTASRTFAR